MLDYALGQREDLHLAQAEQSLAGDERLAKDLERLERHLGLLLDLGPPPEPPRSLVARTLARVEKRRRWQAVLDYAPPSRSFRLADAAVAAGIFVAGLLTLLPAVQRSQVAAKTAQCASNLRQLGVALIRYATTHNTFPFTAPDSPAPYAGTFALQLHEKGLLHDPSLLDCPCDGRDGFRGPFPTFAELHRQAAATPRAVPCLMKLDYGYNIGYCNHNGPCALPADIPGHVPLLADAPPTGPLGQALLGNSPNHWGRGQNVLQADGTVRFLRSRSHGPDDDIFNNRQLRTAPGLDPDDFVVGSPHSRVDGK